MTTRLPSDDDLVLFYYGESERAAAIEALLAASPEAAARYAELRRVLDTVAEALPVPARPADYGAQVWRRVAPRLPARRPGWGERLRSLLAPAPGDGRRLLPLAAAALLLVVGFVAGRVWPPDAPAGGPDGAPRLARTLSSGGRDQILLASVAGHLESSERLLVELNNVEPERRSGEVELAAERRWAQELLGANRLYRQSAEQGGRPRLAALLDELEPLLLELAHTPEELPAAELDSLRARIEARALLFKTRIVAERLERLLQDAEPGASTL